MVLGVACSSLTFARAKRPTVGMSAATPTAISPRRSSSLRHSSQPPPGTQTLFAPTRRAPSAVRLSAGVSLLCRPSPLLLSVCADGRWTCSASSAAPRRPTRSSRPTRSRTASRRARMATEASTRAGSLAREARAKMSLRSTYNVSALSAL
eukprot:2804556-Pleurochrysis_carterae.AAC.2